MPKRNVTRRILRPYKTISTRVTGIKNLILRTVGGLKMKTLREVINHVNKVLKDDYERPVIAEYWNCYDEKNGRKLNSLCIVSKLVREIICKNVDGIGVFTNINENKIIVNHDIIIFTTKRKRSEMPNGFGDEQMTVVEIDIDKEYSHLLDKDITDIM